MNYKKAGDLDIAEDLYNLIATEVIPETGVEVNNFWSSLEEIVSELQPRNTELLARRDQLQSQIDEWHKTNRNEKHDPAAYKKFLQEIGYLVPEGENFSISTSNVDLEIAKIAGPQLVVPLDNARYVLNAVNARWGSVYDAFYSTDTISEANGCRNIKKYNPIRGERVIERARHLLDRHFALERDTHKHVTKYSINNNQLTVQFGDGSETTLLKPQQFIGYTGEPENPDSVLLRHHNLHLEIKFGDGYFIGRRDHAKIYDIYLESAVTTIMDCEDSVAAVDAADKVNVYRNWLGLMKGDLVDTFEKGGKTVPRRLNPDRSYTAPNGQSITLHGRSMMLVRNVGHLMTTNAVLDSAGREIPEGFLDGMITTLCSMNAIRGNTTMPNSRSGSIYIVKPKMHGPEEVAFTNELFDRIEDCLGLERNTIKVGVMDEERRTTVNLKECIRAVRDRIVFINTGFLDRTGDEIFTSMEAGPVLPKEAIKVRPWIHAYEDWNVDIGLECGFHGKAQIGKGMWAMPDEMKAMMETKIAHLKAGANCAWVPSPTAATLHATHYLRYSVNQRQEELMSRARASLDDILTPPMLGDRELVGAGGGGAGTFRPDHLARRCAP